MIHGGALMAFGLARLGVADRIRREDSKLLALITQTQIVL